VSGVCLTVAAGADGALAFDAVPETLRRSALGGLEAGDRVNIEPALAAGDPLGGHFVQGHVDALGRVRSLEPEGEGRRLVLDLPAEVARLCVEKGSIAIDGVSLTIAALSPQGVEIALVPHTLAVTTLVDLDPGDVVNVEADILAKHVERLLRARGSAA
jgi:riboflavin synthase